MSNRFDTPYYDTWLPRINKIAKTRPAKEIDFRQECPFKVGDTVRLKTGVSPMYVLELKFDAHTHAFEIRCEYLSSRKQLGFRPTEHFVMYENNTAKQFNDITAKKETDMTNKLFKTVDGNRYGEYRAKDGDNYLLFMSDTNAYEAFAPSAVKRVMPYTYDVMFAGTGKVYSYIGNEGELAVGDFLLGESMTLARVVAINTESENATKRFVGVKLTASTLR